MRHLKTEEPEKTPTGSGAAITDIAFNTSLSLTTSDFTTVPSHWMESSDKGRDGFGKFSWDVGNNANAYRTNDAKVVITLGTASDAAPSNFEIANSSGFMFASHLIPSAGDTGFIANGNAGTLPEPTSLALWGLMGLAGVVYRRGRKFVS